MKRPQTSSLPWSKEPFWGAASSARGQFAGVVLVMVPAVANALPLAGGARGAVLTLAVCAGFAGSVLVFGGLIYRAHLTGTGLSLDQRLASVPRGRTVYASLALLACLLLAATAWSAGLLFGDRSGEHLAAVALFGLPAATLGWACWRARLLLGG